ncbi:probable protein NLP5 at N-terminal half [Coccomyxa sp. Obi]|nr:probable protein NLP5 at N-terminal half [Coccomyxa sp. Obi]
MVNTEVYDLPHSVEQRGAMASRIARAVLNFQDQLLEADSNTGSLCQVWLPEVSEDGDVVLRTKGLPFCVAGVGDLLALFRCISCRYCFGTDATKPDMLGAPGRVFTTQEPEMSRNVQKYSKDVYLRASEAQQCRVHSTIVLPLFTTAERKASLGVVEVVQTRQDMSFAEIISALARSLEDCDLYTTEGLRGKEMAESSDAIRQMVKCGLVPSGSTKTNSTETDTGTGGDAENEGTSRLTGRASSTPSVADKDPDADAAALEAEKKRSLGTRTRNASLAADLREALRQQTLRDASVKEAPAAAAAAKPAAVAAGGDEQQMSTRGGSLSEEEVDMDEDDDLEDETEEERARRKGKGVGNPGKPGKRLRLEDLQSQFGVGLKEAANRLGICPTTLKRACRRHGIQRWPRRQLLKLSRAIDQINATGSVKNADGSTPASGQPLPGPDTRWTALAQLIPGIAVQPDNRQPQKTLPPGQAIALTNGADQRMLQRVDSCASVDPFTAQQQQQQQQHHVAAGAGMQQHYHSTNSLQPQVSASSPASYALHGHPSAGHLHASPDSNSGAATGDAAGGDGSVHCGQAAFQYMQAPSGAHGQGHYGNSMPLPIPGGSPLQASHPGTYPGATPFSAQPPLMSQVFDGAQHISAPLSMPAMSMGHVQSQPTQYHSPPGMVGNDGMYRGQGMLSYANQRSMIDAKMDGGSQAWMHHSGGGNQHQMDLFPSVDDLDDDVGLVDAEVLEMLLSR